MGFSSVLFPWWMLGIILLNAVPFLLAPPALVCVVCSMISNDDVLSGVHSRRLITGDVHGIFVINPRRACAARVTVVVLCVYTSRNSGPCVCLRLFSHYRLRGGL